MLTTPLTVDSDALTKSDGSSGIDAATVYNEPELLFSVSKYVPVLGAVEPTTKIVANDEDIATQAAISYIFRLLFMFVNC